MVQQCLHSLLPLDNVIVFILERREEQEALTLLPQISLHFWSISSLAVPANGTIENRYPEWCLSEKCQMLRNFYEENNFKLQMGYFY